MNGLTHTGFDQVGRRCASITIEANYDEGEVLDGVNFATVLVRGRNNKP